MRGMSALKPELSLALWTFIGEPGRAQRGGEGSQAPEADDGVVGGGCAFWSRLVWPWPCSILEVSDSPWQQRPRGGPEEEGASLPRRGHWLMSGDIVGCHAGSGPRG